MTFISNSWKHVLLSFFISSKSNLFSTVKPHSRIPCLAIHSNFFVFDVFIRCFRSKLSFLFTETSWVRRYFPRTSAADRQSFLSTDSYNGIRKLLSINLRVNMLLLADFPDGKTVLKIWIPEMLSILNLFCEFGNSSFCMRAATVKSASIRMGQIDLCY